MYENMRALPLLLCWSVGGYPWASVVYGGRTQVLAIRRCRRSLAARLLTENSLHQAAAIGCLPSGVLAGLRERPAGKYGARPRALPAVGLLGRFFGHQQHGGLVSSGWWACCAPLCRQTPILAVLRCAPARSSERGTSAIRSPSCSSNAHGSGQQPSRQCAV